MAITPEEAKAELARRRGLESPAPQAKFSKAQLAAINELKNRGRDDMIRKAQAVVGAPAEQLPRPAFLQEALDEMAEEIGPLEAAIYGTGRGMINVAEGLGIAGPEQTGIMESLKEQRPITTTGGEIAGEAAPFLVPGTAVGRIPSTAGRLGAVAGLGATEGGILSRAQGADPVSGAGVGAGVGLGAEILLPVVGRLGRKIFQRVTGRMPRGAMLDMAGRPTEELNEALNAAGLSFDDLTNDAMDIISKQKPGADPGQVARKALFAEEGIPASRGDIIQGSPEGFRQQATEQRLLESVEDPSGEMFRNFKLQQSEAIEETLRKSGMDVTNEETGGLVQEALSERKKLLRSEKNELYDKASQSAKEFGDVPIFTDSISEAIPGADTMEDLAITAEGPIKSLNLVLQKYGLQEISEEGAKYGFNPTPLTVSNFERFRKTLNRIERADTSGAASVAIGPIKEALDREIAELGSVAAERGVPESVVQPLLEARKTVRQLKTEFSPQSLVGRIVDTKKDGVTQIIEGSKVFDKMVAKSVPVEDVKKVVTSLKKSPKGKQALASLQASVIMDLVNAGFTTQSRKIKGKGIFNPIAFKNRLKTIGSDKMQSLFSNSPSVFKKIYNIDKIAKELTPPAGAVQKGSANIIMDYLNKLGIATIAGKVPGGALLVGGYKSITDPVKKGVAVRKALKAEPEVEKFRDMIENNFPGIASAMAIPATIEKE